jgi:hypothetical protein
VCPKCDPLFRKRYTVIDGFTHQAGTAMHDHPRSSIYCLGARKR